MDTVLDMSLFEWAFIIQIAVCLLYGAYLVSQRAICARLAAWGMGVVCVLQIAALVNRSVSLRHIPFTDMFEYIAVLCMLASALFFVILFLYRHPILHAFYAFLVLLLMIVGSLLPQEPSMQLVPALQSYWLPVHVTLAALSEVMFFIAFVSSMLYAVKKLPCISRITQQLPGNQLLDTMTNRALLAGYPMFSIGVLFAGALWAKVAWGSYWSWDPKEIGALVVWGIYSGYFYVRFIKKWNGMQLHYFSIAGFAAALLSFLANLVVGGMHSYN